MREHVFTSETGNITDGAPDVLRADAPWHRGGPRVSPFLRCNASRHGILRHLFGQRHLQLRGLVFERREPLDVRYLGPPDLAFHFWKDTELIPRCRHISAVSTPLSCCFRIAKICSSLSRDLFAPSVSFVEADSTSRCKRKRGSGQVARTEGRLGRATLGRRVPFLHLPGLRRWRRFASHAPVLRAAGRPSQQQARPG